MISGRGSNLQSLLDSFDPLHVAVVVTNQVTARGQKKAKRYGIPVLEFPVQKNNWMDLLTLLKERKIEGLFLAGFMKIVPEFFLAAFQGRIVNIHPSLLPHYPGLRSFERALADKVQTGASLHFVDPGVDTGKVIKQKKLSRIFDSSEAVTAQWQLSVAEKFLTTSVLRSHWAMKLEVA